MASKKFPRGLLQKKKRKTVRSRSKSKREQAKIRKLQRQLKKVKRELALEKSRRTRETHYRARIRSMREVWAIELRARKESRRVRIRIAEQQRLLQKIEQKREIARAIAEPIVHQVEFDLDTPTAIRDNLITKLKKFNARMGFDSTVDGSIQSDLSVLIETEYYEMDKLDNILLTLSEEIQSYGPQFKICIAPIFDPAKLVHPIEDIEDGKAIIRDNPYNLYKGKLILPMNVSGDVVGTFANFQYDILEKMIEFTGEKPDTLRVILLWGDVVMSRKVNRDYATSENKFELDFEE